jgi:hypothetical protein
MKMISMKRLVVVAVLIFGFGCVHAQKPKSGTYTYTILFAEWQNKSLGTTCKVVVKRDSIKVINNGTGRLTGKKGDVIEQGIIMKHKSGKWIIGHSKKDKYAPEIGGCSGGPSVIDFKRRKFYIC